MRDFSAENKVISRFTTPNTHNSNSSTPFRSMPDANNYNGGERLNLAGRNPYEGRLWETSRVDNPDKDVSHIIHRSLGTIRMSGAYETPQVPLKASRVEPKNKGMPVNMGGKVVDEGLDTTEKPGTRKGLSLTKATKVSNPDALYSRALLAAAYAKVRDITFQPDKLKQEQLMNVDQANMRLARDGRATPRGRLERALVSPYVQLSSSEKAVMLPTPDYASRVAMKRFLN